MTPEQKELNKRYNAALDTLQDADIRALKPKEIDERVVTLIESEEFKSFKKLVDEHSVAYWENAKTLRIGGSRGQWPERLKRKKALLAIFKGLYPPMKAPKAE